jgi:hypothetical protein
MHSWIRAVVVLSLFVYLLDSFAADGDSPEPADPEKNKVRLNGFLTTSFTQGQNDGDIGYLNNLVTKDLSLDTYENRLGIQVSSDVADDVEITAQIIARGGIYNYNAGLDWAYLNYHPTKSFNMHIGKYKVPMFIVSDYVEVGYAYPWVRPPQDVYYINPLTSQSGVKLFYNIPLGQTSLLFQLYYGEGMHEVFVPPRSIDLGNADMSVDQRIKLKTKNAAGGNMSFKTEHFSLRFSYFDTKVDAPEMNIENASGNFASAGLTVDWNDIILYAEYANRDTDTDEIRAFPDQKAWYTTLAYRFSSVMPYATYSEIKEGNDPNILSIDQTSSSLGLRYELNKATAVKFEALHSKPGEENHGLFNEPVEEGMIYSMTVDAIF